MTEEDLKRIITSVHEAVTETVNGKIDRIQKTLDEHTVTNIRFDERLDTIEAKLDPIWETYSNLGGFRKTVMSTSILIGSAAGIVLGLSQIVSFFNRT